MSCIGLQGDDTSCAFPGFRSSLCLTNRLWLDTCFLLYVTNILRSCLAGVGLQADKFSSHSFRCGRASWAFKVQVPAELIKVHGDWSSSAYLVYLDMSVDQRLRVAQRMLQCTPSPKEYW